MKFSQALSRARTLILSTLPVLLVLCAVNLPTFAAQPAATSLAAVPTTVAPAMAAPIQDDAAEEEAPAGDSLMDTFQKGGTFGWLIIALSIVALALIIENFVSLRRDKLAPPELIDEIEALFEEDQFQDAMELCENEPCYFTRVCGAGVAKIGHSFEVIEKSLEEMGDEESIKLHQKIGWLSLIANVAPMMGLLGTVGGMVSAFNTIATSGGQASPAELAGGISQALLTTMFGLVVAIPVTGSFAYLRNNLVRSVIEVSAIVEDLFERFRPES
ncbi:MAG: biopolymer transport protein ExbB [Planctomycetota bacterium]|jgi:biopolymer transport protein ExbB